MRFLRLQVADLQMLLPIHAASAVSDEVERPTSDIVPCEDGWMDVVSLSALLGRSESEGLHQVRIAQGARRALVRGVRVLGLVHVHDHEWASLPPLPPPLSDWFDAVYVGPSGLGGLRLRPDRLLEQTRGRDGAEQSHG